MLELVTLDDDWGGPRGAQGRARNAVNDTGVMMFPDFQSGMSGLPLTATRASCSLLTAGGR